MRLPVGAKLLDQVASLEPVGGLAGRDERPCLRWVDLDPESALLPCSAAFSVLYVVSHGIRYADRSGRPEAIIWGCRQSEEILARDDCLSDA